MTRIDGACVQRHGGARVDRAQNHAPPAEYGRNCTEYCAIDRPFMFFIRDLPTGAIAFAGQVTSPGTRN